MTIRRVIMSATSRIKGGRPSKPETKGEKNVATKAQIRAFQSKSSPIYKSQSESSLVSGFNNLSIADKRKQSSNKPPINRRGFCTSNSGRLNIRSLQDAAMLFKNEQVQNVVVVAGAGISTPSGIPDFRTPGTGLYDNLQQYKIPYPEAIFDIDYFHHNPKPFFTLAKELFPSLGNYRPNYIHYFIKLLHEKGLLLRMYTQNIDGLERLAGIPASKLVEAHGTFATATCTLCGDRCDGDDIKERISLEQIPKCKKKSCSGMVKPDIVFFGEDLPRKFYYHLKDMLQADVVLVMGTSLEVQPFAGIIDSVRWNVPRVLFNRDVVGPFKRQRRSKDFVAEGDILETLQKFSAMIGWQDEMREIITKSEGCYNVGKVTVPPSVPKPPSKQPGIKDPFVKAIWHQNARFDVFEYSSSSDSESSSEESSTESDSSQDRKKPRPVSERLYNKSKHSAKNKSAFNSNASSANRKYSTQPSTQSARTATTKPSAGSKRHVPVIKGSRRNSLTGCNGAILPASTTVGNASSSSGKIGSAKNSVDINVQSTTTGSNSSSSSSRKIGSAKNSVKVNVQSTTTDGTPSSSGDSVNINVQPTATESTLSSSSGKVGTSKNSVNGNVQPITTDSTGISSSGKIVDAINSVNINVQPNGTGSTFSTSTTATESTGATSSGKIGTSVNSVNVNVQPLIRPPVSLNSLSRSNSVSRQPEKFSPPSNHQPKSSNYPNSSNSHTKSSNYPNSSNSHTKSSNSQSKYSNSYHSQSQFSNSSSSQPNSSNSQPQSTNSQPNYSNSQPQSSNSQPNSYNSQSSSSQMQSYNSQTKSTDSPPNSSNSQPKSYNSSSSQSNSFNSQPKSTNSQTKSYNSSSSQSYNSQTKSTDSQNSQTNSSTSQAISSNSLNSQPQSTNSQSYNSSSSPKSNSSPTKSSNSQSKYSNFSNSQTKSSNSQTKSSNSSSSQTYNSQNSQSNSYNSPTSSSNSQTKSYNYQTKPTTSQTKDNSRKDSENVRNGLSPVKTLRAFRERTRSADLPKLRLREKLRVRKVVETSSSESVNGTSSSNS